MQGVLVDELIRYIRKESKMNQEQFASALGTTAISINRWERGKTVPNKMAQKHIYHFCTEHGIRIAEFVAHSVHREVAGHLILYHGSKNGIEGKIGPVSRGKCDFGAGFYMGTNPIQPLTLICGEDDPIIYTVDFDLTGLNVLEIGLGLDWAMLIAYYRGYMKSAQGTEVYNRYATMAHGYDVILGPIANDRMYRVVTAFFEMTVTEVALIKSLSALDLGMQYVAITQKACDHVTILEQKQLSFLYLFALMDMAVARRDEGMSLADSIIAENRRTGRYFDEILKGG
jgi:DNA-binding XRE family transcriptional regulator